MEQSGNSFRHIRNHPRLAAGLLATCAMLVPIPSVALDLLVVNKGENTLSIVDLESGKVRTTLATGRGPHEVAVSPDGRLAAVTDYGDRQPNNTLTVFTLNDGKPLQTVDLGEHSRPHGAQFLPDNRRLAVTTEGSGHLLVVDVINGRVLQAVATEQEVSHMVALSPDAKRAYVANIGSGSLSVVDLEAGALVKNIPTGEGAEGVAVTPDGGEIWVSNRAADTVSVIDAESLEVVATLPSAGFPIRVVMTPDGKLALVTNARAGELAVFDVATRKEIARLGLAEEGIKYRETMLGRAALPIGVIASAEHVYVAVTGGDYVAEINPDGWRIVRRLAVGREPDGLGLANP